MLGVGGGGFWVFVGMEGEGDAVEEDAGGQGPAGACLGGWGRVPCFPRVRLGGTRDGRGSKKGCVVCWAGSSGGGSAGFCMDAFQRRCVRSASCRMPSRGSMGHGSAVFEGVVEVVIPQGLRLFDPSYCGVRCVGPLGGSLAPIHCREEGFPRGVGAACGCPGLKEVLLASRGVLGVYFLGVGLGCHDNFLCPVECPPLGLRLKHVDGELFGGRVESVPWGDGNLGSGGVEGLGGHAAEELVDVERCDWVVGALSPWGHCLDSGVVPGALVGGGSVECGYDDVMWLPLEGYVSLCATMLG